MRRFVSAAALAATVAAFSACAGGSGGASGGADVYRETLGRATPYDFSRYTRQILRRYQYVIERSDSTPSGHVFRTRWRNRYPFEDELALGAVDARTRLVIRARSRGGAGGPGAGDLRAVEFVAENQVKIGGTGEWRLDLLTDMFEDYVKEISGSLESRFQGTRVY